MSGTPLKQALAAAEVLVDLARARRHPVGGGDDHNVTTVVPPTLVTAPAAIRKDIRKIRAGGTTNLHGGWVKGCKHALGREGERGSAGCCC